MARWIICTGCGNDLFGTKQGEREENGEGAMDESRKQLLQHPTDVINGFQVRPGYYNFNGAFERPGGVGVNFTVHSVQATACTLVLFRNREDEPYALIPFPEDYRIGNTYSMIVYDLNISELEYAYQFDGPFDPKKGLIFDKRKFILDPYARAVAGQRLWGEKQDEGFFYKARVVRSEYDWGKTKQPQIPFDDLIIYEAHVRGFTEDKSSRVKNKGTFAGIREKIPYLLSLGVNAVELMPVFEFDEMEDSRVVDGKQLYNYWGYSPVCFFAPNTSYSSMDSHNREGLELKKLIRELNQNGIEVILDVVFNHTAEGNEKGPFFSFKGIRQQHLLHADPGWTLLQFQRLWQCTKLQSADCTADDPGVSALLDDQLPGGRLPV